MDNDEIDNILNIAGLLSQKNGRLRSKESLNKNFHLPNEISIKITTRCTFRCKHCYLYNNSGYYLQFDRKTLYHDIDLGVIEKLLYETKVSNSAIRLSGGEPLVYSEWDGLTEILHKYQRKTSLFTNGFLLDKYMDSILRISKNLTVVFSLDGTQSEHNKIRGRNTFERIIRNIQDLIQLKKRSSYCGNITINSFLSNDLAENLSEFLEFLIGLGVDKIYLNFPWHIDSISANCMDQFYRDKLSVIYSNKLPSIPSWHTFTYHLSLNNLNRIRSILKGYREKISEHKIKINPYREYLKVIENDSAFTKLLRHMPLFCTAVSRSMIVQSTGTVTACTAFPELEIGHICNHDVSTLWNSDRYNLTRNVLSNSILPGKACLKCPYLSSNFYNL